MISNFISFLLGFVFGMITIIIIACCMVDSDLDREEERRYEQQSKGGSWRA